MTKIKWTFYFRLSGRPQSHRRQSNDNEGTGAAERR